MAKKKPQAESEVEAATQNVAAVPPLRLEWRNPTELAENPRNWRAHPEAQIAALTDVMSEVGWAGACLFNERTGRLVDGHARRKVALEQGAEKIPVLVGSWDEATEAKILATLDPLAAMAEADKGKLDALLREVQTGSESVAVMLTELAESAGVVPIEEGEWPSIGGSSKQTFVVSYSAEDEPTLKAFLGVEELPPNKTGSMVLERIKEVVAHRADQ